MAANNDQAYTVLADATAMMDEVYEMEPIAQSNRFGDTAKHITRETQWKGGALHKKILSQIFTGATASATLESDAPDAYNINTTDIQLEESHLRKLAFTISHTIPAQMEVDGGKDAVWNLAKELVVQAQENIGEKRNQLINSNADCVKAEVAALYNLDGTTYSDTQSFAFIKISDGSISNFHIGEILDIRAASDNANIRSTVQVNAVCHSPYYQGSNIGPGIIVESNIVYGNPLATGTGNGTTTQDQYLNNLADGDEIVTHGEGADGFPASFSTLCDLGASPSSYFGITRAGTTAATAKNHYLIPYGRDYTSGGASTVLDLDTHFGHMADTMGYVFGPSRAYRMNRGFQLTDAIICQAQPDLVNEMARQAGEGSQRFTRRIASDMDAASRQKLVAVAGWNGSVLFNPNLPPIVLQPEPLAPSDTIRIFEPSSYEWIRMGSKQPRWIKAPGGNGMWHVRRNVTTGNLTMILDASGFCIETFFCDQPQLTYSIQGVTTSLS